MFTRSLGTATPGITDQYADGKAAKVWQLYIGDQSSRTQNYRTFLTSLLKEKRVNSILDTACGTGVDSVMLLEDGFNLTSADASDKMLKVAHKATVRNDGVPDITISQKQPRAVMIDLSCRRVGRGGRSRGSRTG